MASSKLLKEAIADAKAVRETAIANAKIALEEAFTPRLQSILSRKLQAEMEGEEEEVVEDIDSSEIGNGDNNEPAAVADDASTDLGVSDTEEETAEVGEEADETEVVDDLTEEEDVTGAPEEDVTNATYDVNEEEEVADEDELDLEAIIRELEGELDAEEETPVAEEWDEEEVSEEDEMEELPTEEPAMEEEYGDEEVSEEEEIDLDEILREMGYGDDEEVTEEEDATDATAELEAELEEAYKTIKSLRGTINEVNLLNAKLLYANKLFRSYNLNNEQKVKVVENLDRTSSVREVKLVYATIAESMKFTGTEKKVSAKKTMTEGLASKPVASTAPKKEIISENTNELANRFKELAGIVRK